MLINIDVRNRLKIVNQKFEKNFEFLFEIKTSDIFQSTINSQFNNK